MVDIAPQAIGPAEIAAAPSARRYYVLGVLTLVYALNFLDRTIFNVLIEPIKKEFVLSDTTMGLLAGFGFVLFYSLLGIPIARLADRLNRRNIVAIAQGLQNLAERCAGRRIDAAGFRFVEQIDACVGQECGGQRQFLVLTVRIRRHALLKNLREIE